MLQNKFKKAKFTKFSKKYQEIKEKKNAMIGIINRCFVHFSKIIQFLIYWQTLPLHLIQKRLIIFILHIYQGWKLEAASKVPMAPKGRKARHQIYDSI